MTPTRRKSEIHDSLEVPADELSVVSSGLSIVRSAADLPGLSMLEELASEASVCNTVPQRQPIDWQDLHQRIAAITEFNAAFQVCADAITTAFPQVEVRWVSCSTDTSGNLKTPEATKTRTGEETALVQQIIADAFATGRSSFGQKLEDGDSVSILPSRENGGCVLCRSREPINDRLVSELQLLACALRSRKLERFYRSQKEISQRLAGLLELNGLVASHSQFDSAAHAVCRSLKSHFNAAYVAMGFCEADGCVRLRTDSENSQETLTSDKVQTIESVLQESLIRQRPGIWPPEDLQNQHALCCHAQFGSVFTSRQVVTFPIKRNNETDFGAVVVSLGDSADSHDKAREVVSFLEAAEESTVRLLQLTDDLSVGPLRRLGRSVCVAARSNRIRSVVACLLIFLVAMLIPVDYTVNCRSELQPLSRRFISVPFAAPLRECLVAPGDLVESGQMLALLDGKELNWELAQIRAELGKATKEHDALLAEREFSRAAIARHEMERLQNRSALLLSRIKSLEICSPVSGVVVAGDLRDSDGIPLQAGDSLFEIAPLDKLMLEVNVPEDDVRFVESGMRVTVVMDAAPSEPVNGVVERIHPKAELRDQENVFVAEVALDDSFDWMRPGMRGSGTIRTGERPLGWNLFHNAFAHGLALLGW